MLNFPYTGIGMCSDIPPRSRIMPTLEVQYFAYNCVLDLYACFDAAPSRQCRAVIRGAKDDRPPNLGNV